MWERARSRMRWISQQMYRLIHRIREQARSHIWFVVLFEALQKLDVLPMRSLLHHRCQPHLLPRQTLRQPRQG